MNIFESIILGLIQGLTEFLPVSSSGHLVLGGAVFGLEAGDITFEVLLHLATFLAVIVFFFKEILGIFSAPFRYLFSRQHRLEATAETRYFLLIVIGTIPAVLVGFFLKDHIERIFDSVIITGIMLLVTSLILFLTIFARPSRRDLKLRDSIFIGIAQAVAILPGISRSGSTISAGMFLGVDKGVAFNFSFLLSLPAIFGASLLKINDAHQAGTLSENLLIYLPGIIMAFISGYVSLVVLRRIVVAGKFAYFGIYTLILGILAIIFSHG